jgi:hypothetical protein
MRLLTSYIAAHVRSRPAGRDIASLLQQFRWLVDLGYVDVRIDGGGDGFIAIGHAPT